MSAPNHIILQQIAEVFTELEIPRFELAMVPAESTISWMLRRFKKRRDVKGIDFDEGRFRFHLSPDPSAPATMREKTTVGEFIEFVENLPSDLDGFNLFVADTIQKGDVALTIHAPISSVELTLDDDREKVVLWARLGPRP